MSGKKWIELGLQIGVAVGVGVAVEVRILGAEREPRLR